MDKQVYSIQTNDASSLVKKADYNTKIDGTKTKISDHDKYLTTQDSVYLKSGNSNTWLTQNKAYKCWKETNGSIRKR